MSILPKTSGDLERRLESLGDRYEIETNVDDLWNPEKCPANALVYLAWALSVDYWNDEWSEHIKRNVVSSSLDVHRLKGTSKSLHDAINALGYSLEIEYWHQNSKIEKGKFRVKISSSGVDVSDGFYSELLSVINENKRGTLHLDAFDVISSSKLNPKVAAFTRLGERVYSFPR